MIVMGAKEPGLLLPASEASAYPEITALALSSWIPSHIFAFLLPSSSGHTITNRFERHPLVADSMNRVEDGRRELESWRQNGNGNSSREKREPTESRRLEYLSAPYLPSSSQIHHPF